MFFFIYLRIRTITIAFTHPTMRKNHFFYRVFDLYYDGFRHMTLGRTLWAIILIKLFIIFVVLKLFFFPNFLKHHAEEGNEAQYVGEQMVEREQP